MTTKRGDQPAHAQSVAVGPGGDMYTSCDFVEQHGMTIRKQFAIRMAAALRAGKFHDRTSATTSKMASSESLAKQAIKDADALLAELEKLK